MEPFQQGVGRTSIASGRGGRRIGLHLIVVVIVVAGLVPAGAAAARATHSDKNTSPRQRRFGPGVCGPVDPTYIQGATATGGQPFFLSTAEVAQSARIMSASHNTELLLWTSSEGVKSYSVPIDPSVTRTSFSATFDNTGGTLTLISPDGGAVHQGDRIEDTILNCGRVVTVDAPAVGLWRVVVAPSGRFWLVGHAKTELSIVSTEFVAIGGRPGHEGLFKIQGQPIAGRPATLRVTLSEPVPDPVFRLVSIEGESLQAIDLKPESESEFIGTAALPREPFRVMATGADDAGRPFQRVFAALFHAEVVDVVPQASDDSIVAGQTTPLTFLIRNHGPAVHLRLTASGAGGRLQPVEPSTAHIDANAELLVTVRVSVPADAATGTDASVLLTAEADGPSGPMNYARKQLTVRGRQ